MQKMKYFIFIICYLLFITPLSAQITRSFNSIFPSITEEQRELVFSDEGLVLAHAKNQPLTIRTSFGTGIDLHNIISRAGFPYLVESLLVVPNNGRPFTNLDAYNALGRIADLSGRLYSSHSRGEEVPLFQEATRITSDRRNNLPDPPRASVLPQSETIFVRLRDANFGNTFYRADFTRGFQGVTFNLTNTRNISYLLFTVMREERFNAILYLEPLEEGMLVYSVAGADVSDFIAGMIHIPSAISKRLEVFIGWVSDGLKSM